MAVQQSQVLPAQFVQDLGQDLAKQVTAQSGVPVVSTGIAGISQQPGETAADFTARQQAAREFTTRQQSLSGLAPQVAGQDALQTQAQTLAQQGVGSFQPFLNQAQTQATLASGLGTQALGQLGGIGTELTEAGTTGATSFQQGVQDFMSPYQSQVIDATLSEFDRNKAVQEQSIRDQQAALGALGSGRAGVQLAEFGTGAARERALLQAGLLQQGFGQAAGARQQDIANRFGIRSSTSRTCRTTSRTRCTKSRTCRTTSRICWTKRYFSRSNTRFRCISIWISWSTSTTWSANTSITRYRYFTFRSVGRTEPNTSTSRS
jgi:hypothetical protein